MSPIALLLLALPVATALLVAASARLPSLVSTLLVAYLALVAELALVTWALSPADAVTRNGLAAASTVLFLAAVVLWWLRGRPRLPLEAASTVVRRLVDDRVTLVFLGLTVLLLGYELVLVLAAPANNWDSLTYHLARAAAWAQEGGIHWIPNAPTDRLNEFQPLAEQQILYLFVAAGDTLLFALPQYLAQLAILVAVYGAARRLGFEVAAAAGSAFLLATFSLVALEATTAQNDLVAASFPIVAACLVLGGLPIELVLAGAALGFGLGAKLTTLLAWPVLALLLWRRGRRAVALAAAGAAAGFFCVGYWGFVLNVLHTDKLLGRGGGRTEATASPSFPETIETALRLVYRMLDLSVLSNPAIVLLGALGVLIVSAGAVETVRRRGWQRAFIEGLPVGWPFLAPALVAAAAMTLAFLTDAIGIPVETDSSLGGLNRFANEDYSAFGPIGAAALAGACVAALLAYRARRVGLDRLALALALPSFLVLLSLYSASNPFLTRFLLVPAVLTAPLFGVLFVSRTAIVALLTVAFLTVAVTLSESRTKPLDGPQGRPWELSQATAVMQTWQPAAGQALAEFDRLVPSRACVGAVLAPDEPSYLLWGRSLERRIVFLPVNAALVEAYEHGLFYVVVSAGPNSWVVPQFEADGWSIRPLSGYWILAVAPRAQADGCADGRG